MSSLPTQYHYADGSGNRYLITQESIEYIPVKPAESSSGTYSGGEYAKKVIQTEDYQKVKTAFEQAFENKAIHIENRIMRSGALSAKTGSKEKSVIIKPDATEQTMLEQLLKALLNAP
jgi:hypothetical protein